MRLGKLNTIIGLMLAVLMCTLPLAEALSISNVRVDQITDRSAHVLWTTDQPSDSLVTYGGLTKQDNTLTTSHDVVLNDLTPQQQVQFKVRSASGNQVDEDDNNGQLYTFTTASQDTFAPPINVAIPALVNRAHIDISGTTEAGAEIRLFVNGDLREGKLATNGQFSFDRIALATGRVNVIEFTARDAAGNQNTARFETSVDTVKPIITVSLPSVTQVAPLPVIITINEPGRIQVNVNDNDVFNQATQRAEVNIPLNEGSNHVIITATDNAGNSQVEEADILSDTRAPEFEEIVPLEDEPFYYEGRAEDDVRGKTEPGATVYLFVENNRAGFTIPNVLSVTAGTTNRPDPKTIEEVLKKAQYKTTADADGNFKIDDVNFEHPGFGIEEVAPEEIRPGEVRATQNDERVIQTVIIAVDGSGFMTHRQLPVSIGTCATGFGVTITSVPDQQFPAILNPYRLDSGTERISFVLNTQYRGSATVNKHDPKKKNTIESDESYYEIMQVDVRSLCREDNPLQGKDESYEYACQLLGARPSLTPRPANVERTNWYVQFNLGASDKFTDLDEQFWKKTLKSELRFPFDISVTYREKLPGQADLQTRTVTLCRDVSYPVDVPVDPRKVLPDNLLQDAQKITNQTIEVIDKILPTLEKVTRYAGIGCIGSIGLSTVVRVYRKFAQRTEYLSCKALGGLGTITGAESCPVKNFDQIDQCFYLKEGDLSPYPDSAGAPSVDCSTVSDEKDPNGKPKPRGDKVRKAFEDSPLAQEYFSSTIGAWETETQIYTAYRYLCDRVFCRSPPAGWTRDKDLAYIQQKDYEARDCPAPTVRTLKTVENCYEELLKVQKIQLKPIITGREVIEGNVCYRLGGNAYYRIKPGGKKADHVILERIDNYGRLPTANQLDPNPNELVAVPEGNTYILANNVACEQVCKQRFKNVPSSYQCSDKAIKGWFDVGPTVDCWSVSSGQSPVKTSNIELGSVTNVKNSCYCQEDIEATTDQRKAKLPSGAEFAGSDLEGKTVDGISGTWPWSYREWRLYDESGHKEGIYYPTERYYEGRDFPSAFGQDYLLDGIIGEDETTPRISSGSYVGMFQTACLSTIRGRLTALRSLLVGFQRCLKEVETSGKADAGVCKEIFSQLVCNLAYDVFTAFQDQCVPGSPDIESYSTDDDALQTIVKEGTSAVTEGVDSMVKQVHEEYGNAQLDQFLEGGSQSLMKKVCLAAFGIETGFDLDSVLDSAYTTSYETSVGVFSSEGAVGRREFLTFNPQTKQSVYEYRASWIIQPGCNLQNYQLQLVAVTAAEEAQFKSISCSAVNSREPFSETNGCDNYNGAQELRTSFANGRQVSQGAYVDQNVALVIDKSPYRYDHIKVTLYPDARQDANKCFPAENVVGNTGVFYFPIHDATPRDILQCQVETSSGVFRCSLNDDQSAGQAWFERVECWDEDTASYKRCDRMLFTVEDQDEVRVKANVYTDGQKMCLTAFVRTENDGEHPPKSARLWPVVGLGDAGVVPMELDLLRVDDSTFIGDASAFVRPIADRFGNICGDIVVSEEDDVDSQKIGNTHDVKISPVDNKYRVTVEPNVLLSQKSGQPYIIENRIVKKKTAENQFTELLDEGEVRAVRYVMSGYGVTNVFGRTAAGDRTCHIQTVKPLSRRSEEQNWKLELGLFYPNENNDCVEEQLVAAEAPPQTAFKTKESITLNIRNTKASTARTAAFERGLRQYRTASNADHFVSAAAQFATVSQQAPPEGDMYEVEALWWQVASQVRALQHLQRSPRRDAAVVDQAKQNIKGAITQFEARKIKYTVDIKDTEKYRLIEAYMTEVKASSALT